MLRCLNTSGLGLVLALATIVGSTIVGCGTPGPPPTAQVKGKVTLKGEPVKVGQIYFVAPEKGFSANTALSATGEYSISSDLPPASYKVFITPPRIEKPPKPGEQAPSTSADFKIPDRYQTETMSGLTAEIVAGPNTMDFPLE